MIKTIFEERLISCYLDDSIPVLTHRWKSHATAEKFRAILIQLSETFKELKQEYPDLTWAGDTTNLGALSLETQGWLKENWTPILIEAGVKYHALIVPKDVFAKFAMNKFKDNLTHHHKKEIILQQFPDEDTANEWLRSCLVAQQVSQLK
ncbi:MAG: hypothetical protein V4714_12495 [Bacteroidota bacterium]